MDRRQFLLSAAAGTAALTIGGRLFAAPVNSPRFLLVFLRGGYDCNNMLVPCASDFYYASRPSIAIAKPDPANPNSAIALNSGWGLTPALRDTIAPMFQRKEIAFIPFAGTEDMSRSHFETQDSIEAGQPEQGRRDFRSGFLARLSGTLTGVPPIAFTDSLPLSFQGGGDVPNMSLRGVTKPNFDQRQAQILADMYEGQQLHQQVAEGLELRQQVAKDFADEMNKANRGAISAQGFELQAQRISVLMRDQFRLGFVDIGGWDTHVNEGGANGPLAANLGNLGRGLAAYAKGLGNEWNNTVVVVISEFGRTFRENGDKGTDHGHGTVYWVLGGRVHGGRIAGEQVRIEQASLLQNRDYPVLNDYRGIMGGLFTRMWGLSGDRLQRVFPETRPLDLQLV
ncbi:MAG TPA: DUF1501 domain-containing protein [Xanthomonadaceae bacterium]|nr:DUF1501 domain-containing protein [Xanthomonadaceae bacterium]